MAPRPVQQHRRYKLPLDVEVRFGRDDVKRLTTDNVSLGGAFILSSEKRDAGFPLLLRVHFPSGAFAVNARVVHVREGEGLGVQFLDVSQGLEEALTTLFRAQTRDAWVQRARSGLAIARRRVRDTLEQVRASLKPQQEPVSTEAEPWYRKAQEPTGPAADQLRDLVGLAREHEGAGEIEDARVTWLMIGELTKKHPELGVLVPEVPTLEAGDVEDG